MQRVTSSATELIAVRDVRGVDITSANYAVIERLAHWQAAQNMARAYPWFGVGLGNYEVAYNDFRLINWDEPLGHAHNYYLNILAEAGMIGILAYLGLWMSLMWFTWQARSHPDTVARSIIVGLFGSWTYLAVHSLLDNLYVNNLFLHLGVMLGLLAILYHQSHQFYQWESS
jgi:O-antigen ligase